MSDKTEFAWLIGAPGPRWLAVRDINFKEFHWSPTVQHAIRFCSKQQASDVMFALRDLRRELFAFDTLLGDAQPVEHG